MYQSGLLLTSSFLLNSFTPNLNNQLKLEETPLLVNGSTQRIHSDHEALFVTCLCTVAATAEGHLARIYIALFPGLQHLQFDRLQDAIACTYCKRSKRPGNEVMHSPLSMLSLCRIHNMMYSHKLSIDKHQIHKVLLES